MNLSKYLLSLVLMCAAGAAGAQDVTVLGVHGKWTAFTYRENGQQVCYIAAKPDKSEGTYKSRDDVLLLVTHRPAEKAFDVVSVVAGYQYKPDTDAQLLVGNQKFDLFTVGSDRAWARDSKIDRTIVQTMIKGSGALVKGTSGRGTTTTDTYSLSGFTAAHKSISETCKRPN